MPTRGSIGCPHGWREPDDGWVLHKQLGSFSRTMRCRLCGLARLEQYDKVSKTWKATVQMEMYFDLPAEKEQGA